MSLLAPRKLGPCRISSLHQAQLVPGRCWVHTHWMRQERNVLESGRCCLGSVIQDPVSNRSKCLFSIAFVNMLLTPHSTNGVSHTYYFLIIKIIGLFDLYFVNSFTFVSHWSWRDLHERLGSCESRWQGGGGGGWGGGGVREVWLNVMRPILP